MQKVSEIFSDCGRITPEILLNSINDHFFMLIMEMLNLMFQKGLIPLDILLLPSSAPVPAKLVLSLSLDFSSSLPARLSVRNGSEIAGNLENWVYIICSSPLVGLETILDFFFKCKTTS